MPHETTTDDIIDDIMEREDHTGTGKVTVDAGGLTQFGIAKKYNPEAWADGKVTEEEAREIYERKYVNAPGFNKILDGPLRAQLVDYGVNSGPMVAIMKLQAIVGADTDGVIGPQTIELLALRDPREVALELVKARVKMIGRLVVANPKLNLQFLNGWLNRALEFV